MKKRVLILTLICIASLTSLYADEPILIMSTFSSGYAKHENDLNSLQSLMGQEFVVPDRSSDGMLGNGFLAMVNQVISGVSGNISENVPDAFMLFQNYPNPFNPETRINFDIAKATQVKLTIFNIQGQLVMTLVDEKKAPGHYSVVWNGRDYQGRQVSSGVYLFKLNCKEYVRVRILSMIK